MKIRNIPGVVYTVVSAESAEMYGNREAARKAKRRLAKRGVAATIQRSEVVFTNTRKVR